MTQGRGQIARAALLANNVTHDNEMYGTGAVYLRAKNIVPPSTENSGREPIALSAQSNRGAESNKKGGPAHRFLSIWQHGAP